MPVKTFEPGKFTARPLHVEAIRLTESAQIRRVALWCGARCILDGPGRKAVGLLLDELRPDLSWNDKGRSARVGQWIVRDETGLVFVVDDDEFTKTYQPQA
jgi:hypothetical protein